MRRARPGNEERHHGSGADQQMTRRVARAFGERPRRRAPNVLACVPRCHGDQAQREQCEHKVEEDRPPRDHHEKERRADSEGADFYDDAAAAAGNGVTSPVTRPQAGGLSP